ncbi:MAG: hypothetical protein LBU35_01655 [Holosporales bacterium]|jgi:hypothetical protein|nr:hypothetical protein [Holosporales bacterium]
MFLSIALLLSYTGCPDFGLINASYECLNLTNPNHLESKDNDSDESEMQGSNPEDTILISYLKKCNKFSKKKTQAVGKFSYISDNKEEQNKETDDKEQEDNDNVDDELAKERLQLLAFSIAEKVAPLQQVSDLMDFDD